MTSKDNIPFHKPIKAILGFLLAWTVPGAGHAFVGRPVRGIIIFIVIGATFWAGIAMGGVMTVDRQEQKWWFAAEMLTGVHGLIGWQRESKRLQTLEPEIQADMEQNGRNRKDSIVQVLVKEKLVLVAPMATVARAYAGVAGLLNLMCMFDVLMLALIGTIVTTEESNKKGDQQ